MREYPSEDEFGPDKTFPHLQPENLMRGWAEVYMNPVDEHGVHQSDRLRAERNAKIQKIQDARMQQSLDDAFDSIDRDLMEDLGLPVKAKQPAKAPGTLRSKDAASALSNAQSRRVGPSGSSKPHLPAVLNVRKTRQPAPSVSSTRFANASAASKSTLGYAQGRAISQKVRKPITSVFRDDGASAPSRSVSTALSGNSVSDGDYDKRAEEVVAALRKQDLGAVDADLDADLFSPPAVSLDDDDDVFQLPPPE
jgi:hypothetical protein